MNDHDAPFVRVEEAGSVHDGGTARLVLSKLRDVEDVAAAIARSGAVVELVDQRLRVVSTPSRVSDGVGRVLGAQAAEAAASAIDLAVRSWLGGPPELVVGGTVLPTAQRPLVMGIVNVTPDSFSDGGTSYDPEDHPGAAIAAGRRLLEAGADVVDVGGESTRPGAEAVSEQDELDRVLPVIEALAAQGGTVSVDTSKAGVARAAVGAGAALINDVSAGALDGLMLPTVAELGVPYVLMHMRGTPRTMQRDPKYADVVAEVFDFLAETLDRCEVAGIERESVIVDPGIGFGKTVDHNLTLLQRLRELTSLGRPVLIGTSRKSFLGRVSDLDDASERLIPSIVTAALAVGAGASIVRVHDVAETVEAVRVAQAVTNGRQGDAWIG
ncbi:MAG TPA: dihydropteroate synthase [Nitriliruptorales bacterium]